jgi:hypothetical protein
MSKQPGSTIVFLLSLIAGLLFVAVVIGGAAAYRSGGLRSNRSESVDAQNRIDAVHVMRQMEKEGRSQDEIDAYALKRLGSGQ